MKPLAIVALFGVLSGLVAACASVPKLPPKASPEAVEVFYPGSYPTEEFKTLSILSESAELTVSDDELVARARRRAAELGADALLIRSIRETTEGEVSADLGREERKLLEAVAVYYPAKHPGAN